MDTPKTKAFVNILGNLNIANKKSLVLLPEYNGNLYLSLRNVPRVNGTLLSDLNTYDIVNANVLVLTESAAKIFTASETEA
jgi:large subunit ribosomal protein L4